MRKRVDFIGVPVDSLSMNETLEIIESAIISKSQIHHCVINVGKFVKMQNDVALKESVINSDIINADGMGIVWASKLLGKNISQRVTGIDLMQKLVSLASKKDYTCFFLGARESVVDKIVKGYSSKYSKKIIAGYRNGYFEEEEEQNIVNQIKNSNANLLFVAITSPKKEIFLNKYKNDLKNINLIMGVGGSFDVIAGKVKRAPLFLQKNGLEWLYRFLQEPRRMWRRYLLGNVKFAHIVLKEYFK